MILLSGCGTKYGPHLQNVDEGYVLVPEKVFPNLVRKAQQNSNPEMSILVDQHDLILECKGAEIKIKKPYKNPKDYDFGDWLEYEKAETDVESIFEEESTK